MRRILKEPLLHFAALAAVVFIGHSSLIENKRNSDNRIVVSQKEVQRMIALFRAESGVAPSERELQDIVSGHVREVALAREARRHGLAEKDILIERRLAQKMRFMIGDVHEVKEPSSEDLEAWFNANKSQFVVPATFSFQHVFFLKPESEKINAVLVRLRTNGGQDWREFGDPFMLNRVYSDLPLREVSRVFGPNFAEQLSAFGTGIAEWRGPVLSTQGSHLVYILKRTERVIPEFNTVKADVLEAWRIENRRTRTEENIESIVDKYVVVFEAD